MYIVLDKGSAVCHVHEWGERFHPEGHPSVTKQRCVGAGCGRMRLSTLIRSDEEFPCGR